MTIGSIVRAWEMAAAPGGAWSAITAPALAQNWARTGISRDGNTMLAVKFGQAYSSADRGVTWNAFALNQTPIDMDIGDNGRMWSSSVSNLYTSPAPGSAFVRSTISAGSSAFNGQCIPADGDKLYILNGSSSLISFSTDDGATRTNISAAGTRNWQAIACSASGQYVIACANAGTWYFSNDYGVSWTLKTPTGAVVNSTLRVWITDDGSTVYALCSPASGTNAEFFKMNVSTTARTNITLPYVMNTGIAKGMSVSGNGLTILVAETGQMPYESKNGGVNWTAVSALGTKNWVSVDMSSDGLTKIAVCTTASDRDLIWVYK